MKTGIFGGTFNPIHYGHLRAAEEVREMLSLDRILFIPSGKPAFKKPGLINARRRYEMTRIAIKNNQFFEISNIELQNSGTSYSVKTVDKLTSIYKNAEFFFILGIDTFLDLPKWKEPVRFMGLTNLVIILRPGLSFIDLSSSPYLVNVSRKKLIELDNGGKTGVSFSLKTGKKAFLCKIAEIHISASRIRNLVRAGKSIKYLLPDSVESYIISHKLYKRQVKS
jgi:nicotinate-nucleotide adenylyltransferase